MIKKQDGFTLVELMITMVIFVLAIAAASNIFTAILTQFKQQSKIAETNIEGVVGFETLRYDVEQAGYGLPWDMNGATYAAEAVNDGMTVQNETLYNDAPNGIPRAVVSGDNVGMNGSDVLVIKATNASTAAAARRWTYVSNSGAANTFRTWAGVIDETWQGTDSIIVIKPVLGDRQRVLINNAGFSILLNALPSFGAGGAATAFEPLAGTDDTYIVYGIGDAVARMPFNRTDYYVRRPAGNAMPSQCAQNTGVLYKATVNHGDGNLTEFPLVDCVADFQVVFRLDMDEDGTIGTSANADGSTVSSSEGANVATVQATLADAALLRQRLKEIRIYIIAHEGQLDATYTSASTITMDDIGGIGAFKVFDFAALGISRNYRWKLYTLVVTPTNLR